MDFITLSTFVFLLGILVPTVKGTLPPCCFINNDSKAKNKHFPLLINAGIYCSDLLDFSRYQKF